MGAFCRLKFRLYIFFFKTLFFFLIFQGGATALPCSPLRAPMIEALSFRFYMDSFFWVLYGLFLLDLYVLFLLGSIWALSFGFYEGSFFWILYRLFLLDSIWALSFGFGLVLLGSRWTLSFGFYMVFFFGFFLLGSVLALSFGFYMVSLFWILYRLFLLVSV